MNIIFHEIKKLLNWKILLLLLVVNFLLYYFLIDFDIQYFPNGRPALDSYRIGLEMLEKYGPEMDDEEIADFRETYFLEIQRADEFLQNREDAKEVGITTYEEFQESDPFEEPLKGEFRSKIMHDEKVDLFWELQERQRIIEFHEVKDVVLQYEFSNYPARQKNHISTLLEKNHFDVYPEVSFQNYLSIIRNIAVTILISVVLLISPIFIRDKSLRMLDLQYTAKIGRGIFKKKVIAAFISVFLVMTVLLAIYLGIYSQNNPEPFFNVHINSFIGLDFWYDLTFLQYIILNVIAIYTIGFLLTLIALFVSNIVPSYVALVGVQVPVIFILLTVGLRYLLEQIIDLYLPIWLVPMCYIVLLIATVTMVIAMWKKEKQKDIVW